MEDAEATTDILEEHLRTSTNYDYTLLDWSDIELDSIPRKTDMVRSWAFYKAWADSQPGDYCLTLDDDLLPIGDIFEAYEHEFEVGSVLSPYLSVGALTDSGLQMRGFPYRDRKVAEVAVQYGGWSGVLDYDAATQLAVPRSDHDFEPIIMPVPKGIPTTCCIMNTAWRVEYTPIMWQLPMLPDRYNRIGDIWSGLFIKKTLDALGGVMLINGKAAVRHERASDPYKSLQKEAPSVFINEYLWENLNAPKTSHILDIYAEVTDDASNYFAKYDVHYANNFTKARDEWLTLFRLSYQLTED